MTHHRLRCTAVRDETADVRTWTFEDETGERIAFRAGQAITLVLPVEGGTLHRTFSIASSAAQSARIELTVKAPAAGRATQWMRGALRPGMFVEATAPHGRFVLPERPGRLALVSAGSGATPLVAMLRTLADGWTGHGTGDGAYHVAHRDSAATAADIAWIHAARTPADVLFAAELTSLQQQLPRLSVSIAVARPEPGWFGYRGRVNRRLLSVMAPDLASRDVLCCGPAGFMDEVRRIHAAEGGDAARFQVEHFAAVPSPAVSWPSAEPGPASGYTVSFAGNSFQAQPSETILEAAGRGNVVIPCGCGGGMCGTCRMRLEAGTVEMRHQGGLLPEEEAQGWILACSAKPRSDLVLAY